MDSHCASRTPFPTVAVACAPRAVTAVGRPCEVQGGELVRCAVCLATAASGMKADIANSECF